MGYKHREADTALVKAALEEPNFLLKIIPHVDGSPRICELVEYRLEEIALRGAWTGPAALSLTPHALAPVAELPILEIVSAIHIRADLTLGLGSVVHDYLQQPTRSSLRPTRGLWFPDGFGPNQPEQLVTPRHTEFAAFVLDVLGFMEEKIAGALEKWLARRRDLQRPPDIVPLRERLRENEVVKRAGHSRSGQYDRGALGRRMVGRLRQSPRGEFERTGRDLVGPEGRFAILRSTTTIVAGVAP